MTKKEFAEWLETKQYCYMGETDDNRAMYTRQRQAAFWDVFIATNGDVEISSNAFPRAFHGNVENAEPIKEFLTDYLAGNLEPPKEEWDRSNMEPMRGSF